MIQYRRCNEIVLRMVKKGVRSGRHRHKMVDAMTRFLSHVGFSTTNTTMVSRTRVRGTLSFLEGIVNTFLVLCWVEKLPVNILVLHDLVEGLGSRFHLRCGLVTFTSTLAFLSLSTTSTPSGWCWKGQLALMCRWGFDLHTGRSGSFHRSFEVGEFPFNPL